MTVDYEIRKQRSSKGISLRFLANELGLSPSQLSKIETGKAKLTVEMALKIANVLKVPATVFLSHSKPAATGRRTITRNRAGSVQTTPGMKLEALCADFKGNHNLFWHVTITASSFEENGGWRQHPGQEFIFVLSGQLQILSALYEPVLLYPGDSILFDADQPHSYVALNGAANLLMMNSVG